MKLSELLDDVCDCYVAAMKENGLSERTIGAVQDTALEKVAVVVDNARASVTP